MERSETRVLMFGLTVVFVSLLWIGWQIVAIRRSTAPASRLTGVIIRAKIADPHGGESHEIEVHVSEGDSEDDVIRKMHGAASALRRFP